MKITNTADISLEFLPWTDKSCKINKLHLIEKIGGELARGEISLVLADSDETLELITEEQTGTIKLEDTKDNGISYKIPIFITSRSYIKNLLNLQFVCIDKHEFFSKPLSTEFDDITDAINSLYSGKKDIRIKSDINNDIRILQICETNYDLCTRLCMSFKKESIFAYSWEGLILKDLCGEFDSTGKKEPNIQVFGDQLMYPITAYTLTYNKNINKEPYNPWTDVDKSTTQTDYSDKELKNCKVMIDFQDYSIYGTDYETLQYNYRYNLNLMDAEMYSTLKIVGNDMPGYKIGDVLKYRETTQETSLPFEKYIVATNELFYATEGSDEVSPHGFNFEWASTLWGLDSGTWSDDEAKSTT